jgi:hypothetical protein
MEWRARYGHIDFDRSLAWSEELNYAPSVRLSASVGERRDAVLRRVEASMIAWTDDVDGRSIVRAVHRREDLHRGAFVHRSPDLLLELSEPGGYSYVVMPSGPRDRPTARLQGDALRGAKGRGMTGSHRRDGVWIAAGAGLEGRGVRREIAELLPACLGGAPLGVVATGVVEAPRAEPSALARRLRSLGYLV